MSNGLSSIFFIIYMKFLAFCILSILSGSVPVYCNAFLLLLLFCFRYSLRCTRLLQFVSGSLFFYCKKLCFRWPVPPLLRFHDLYIYRLLPLYHQFISELPFLSGFIDSLISLSRSRSSPFTFPCCVTW